MKASNADNRSKDTTTLLTYGFNSFKNYVIYDESESLGEVAVTNGQKEKLNNYSFNIKAQNLKAPLKSGSVVGTAEIMDNDGNIIKEIDIIIKEDLKKATFWDYLKQNFKLITAGK